MLAIKLMRMGAKKAPSYRIVVKEKLSKRDGAYIEKVGFYNPRNAAEDRLDLERVQYWIDRGAQPTDTVRQLIRKQRKAQGQQEESAATA
jgi:small subunit ribosomal protein S16